ncbi:syntaxin-1A-like [Penaeus japonicus]|uniref:syntaxin-1A-like n=1 Tax=Penaeus japonicus TaxID=27405 RepID=UPI001C7100DF|nr:syntaxin-1A-like [Penaeus japonicus]XP_042860790.1 syntaxin-1A-like [Penaeus japonicus]
MVRDRLQDFQNRVEKFRKDGALKHADEESASVTLYIEPDEVQQQQLLDLLHKIGPQYSKLKDMEKDVEDLRGILHEHDSRQRVEEKIGRLKSEVRKIQSCLEEVKKKQESSNGVVQHAARTHHLSLAIHLSLMLGELSGMQIDMHDRHKQYVRKELMITTGHDERNEEELETLLEQSTEIFTQNIIKETQIARQQLQDLQERHEAVIMLEKSITELCQLFQDLALLVHQQGETIDRIESHMFEAQERATKAKEQLQEAVVQRRKVVKKKFILYMIGATCLLVVALIIIFSFVG